MRGTLQRIFRLDVGMHDFASWCGHGASPSTESNAPISIGSARHGR
jgi:hypothetical protein